MFKDHRVIPLHAQGLGTTVPLNLEDNTDDFLNVNEKERIMYSY